jgi:hypothetical protein
LLTEVPAHWQAADVDTSALLGHDHEADGVMQETLTAGSRRTVGADLAVDSGGLGVVLSGFESVEEMPWIGGSPLGLDRKK